MCKLAVEYEQLRRQGIRHAPKRKRDETLADACGSFMALKRVSGKRGPLAPITLKDLERNVDCWAERVTDRRGVPLGQYPLPAIPPVTGRRQGKALTGEELHYLADFAPDYMRHLFLLGGSTGMRIKELFHLDDRDVDFDARTITLRAHLTKERRVKVIDLFDAELRWLREQQLIRRPGATLLFPKKESTKYSGLWQYGRFWTKILQPTLRCAGDAWQAERPGEPCPFLTLDEKTDESVIDFRLHDLRSTGVTLMSDTRMAPEDIATPDRPRGRRAACDEPLPAENRQGSVRRSITAIGADLTDVPATAGKSRATADAD